MASEKDQKRVLPSWYSDLPPAYAGSESISGIATFKTPKEQTKGTQKLFPAKRAPVYASPVSLGQEIPPKSPSTSGISAAMSLAKYQQQMEADMAATGRRLDEIFPSAPQMLGKQFPAGEIRAPTSPGQHPQETKQDVELVQGVAEPSFAGNIYYSDMNYLLVEIIKAHNPHPSALFGVTQRLNIRPKSYDPFKPAQNYMLGEVIKAYNPHPSVLWDVIQQLGIQPNLHQITMPPGRSLHWASNALDQLKGQQQAAPITYSMSGTFPTPKLLGGKASNERSARLGRELLTRPRREILAKTPSAGGVSDPLPSKQFSQAGAHGRRPEANAEPKVAGTGPTQWSQWLEGVGRSDVHRFVTAQYASQASVYGSPPLGGDPPPTPLEHYQDPGIAKTMSARTPSNPLFQPSAPLTGLSSTNTPDASSAVKSERISPLLPPPPSSYNPSRGRKPFDMNETGVGRGLIRLFSQTDVSFDSLARAVEEAGGPRKLWLRSRFTRICGGPSSFDFLRLGHRNKEAAAKRKDQQMAALKAATRPSVNEKERIGRWRESELAGQSHEDDHASLWTAQSFDFDKTVFAYNDDEKDEGRLGRTSNRKIHGSAEGAKEIRSGALNMAAVTKYLDHTKDTENSSGYYGFIGETCSETADSIRSCLSSRDQSPKASVVSPEVSTANSEPSLEHSATAAKTNDSIQASEYYQYHYSPGSILAPDTVKYRLANEPGFQSQVPVLLKVILSSRPDGEADTAIGKVLDLCQAVDRRYYVNEPDTNGVTPLHLAVAYGFPLVCGTLVKNGADFNAVTKKGTTISRFARLAQRLARDNIPLYFRILNCRQFVKFGCAPPSPVFIRPSKAPESSVGVNDSKGQSKDADEVTGREADAPVDVFSFLTADASGLEPSRPERGSISWKHGKSSRKFEGKPSKEKVLEWQASLAVMPRRDVTNKRPSEHGSGIEKGHRSSLEGWLGEPAHSIHQDRDGAWPTQSVSAPIACQSQMLDGFGDIITTHFTKLKSGTLSARFYVDWSPTDFLFDYFPGDPKPRLDQVITLSGEDGKIQAATCRDYIAQTWPKIGIWFIDSLSNTLSSSSAVELLAEPIKYNLGLFCEASIEFDNWNSPLAVTVNGWPDEIIKVGEILAWLSASCRPSPFPDKCSYSRPKLELANEWASMLWLDITCSQEVAEPVEGADCWRQLFQNVNIAKGFPIQSRSHQEPGLEVTTDLMCGLGGTQWATTHNNCFMLRGFSSMFVPMEKHRGSIVWHFFQDDGDKFLPYSTAKKSCINQLDFVGRNLSWLEGSRHFVAWTSKAEIQMGTEDYKYNLIREPGNKSVQAGMVLERATISSSCFVNAGLEVVRGQHQRPLGAPRPDDYIQSLRHARQINVVMYDVAAKRAWLVDGASALLHLTCAQIHSEQFRRDYDLDDMKLKNYATAGKSAFDVLKDPENQYIPLGPRTSSGQAPTNSSLLRDLVLRNFIYLSKIYEHQLEPPSGINIHMTDRDRLEGWSFMNMVNDMPSMKPKMTYLQSSGRGWVHYIRSIQAVTLMGKNFGQLISPVDSLGMCDGWREVPLDRDYLVATIERLEWNSDIYGNREDFPSYLAEGVRWHQAHGLFEHCGKQSCECDPLQVILPKIAIGQFRKPQIAPNQCQEGAVIFGKSRNFPIFWPKKATQDPHKDEKGMAERLDKMSLADGSRSPESDQSPHPSESSRAEGEESSSTSFGSTLESVSSRVSQTSNTSVNTGSLSDPSVSSPSVQAEDNGESSTPDQRKRKSDRNLRQRIVKRFHGSSADI